MKYHDNSLSKYHTIEEEMVENCGQYNLNEQA